MSNSAEAPTRQGITALNARTRNVGILVVIIAKAFDVATTANAGPAGEVNPWAVWMFDLVGFLPAMFVISAGFVTLVILVTELGAWILGSVYKIWYGPMLTRVVGYGTVALLWLVIGVYNLVQTGGFA